MFDDIFKNYSNDHFFLSKGQSLMEVHNMPLLPGVFCIVKLAGGRVQLVYIGKSGTVDNKGRSYVLIDGFTSLGKNIDTALAAKFKKENIDALDIYWAATMNDKQNDLPSYVQGLMMQAYFEVHGTLPPWNKEF